VTLTQARENYDRVKAAYDKALDGQSYTVSSPSGGRSVQRAALADLKKELDYWQGQINRLSGGRIRGGSPC
jgi:hypothetical protein